MSCTVGRITDRQLRAPQEDGTALVEPTWDEVGARLAENRTIWSGASTPLLGVSLSALAHQAREDLVRQALAYTRAYRRVPNHAAWDAKTKLILCGHQPELFHPGVWFKNFVMHQLSAEHGAFGIHLLIDNDIMKSPYVRTPTGSVSQPRVEAVPLDGTAAPVPFEQRSICAPDLFEEFGRHVTRLMRPLVARPIAEELWPYAIEAAGRTRNLGRCLAEARHRLEGAWGLDTLEVPLSQICDAPAFQHFAAYVLVHLPEFQEIYNSSVREYRQAHGLRSQSHPVPLLSRESDWYEAPFWIWSDSDPTRRPLQVRRTRRGIQLRPAGGPPALPEVPLTADALAMDVPRLGDMLSQQQFKLRPRALMTTMFLRLFLSDLFLHGIGGAKYDELTDRLVERCFGLPAPFFMILSATARLPVRHTRVEPDDVRRINLLLRDLWYHPESTASLIDCLTSAGRAEVKGLAEEKHRLLAERPPSGPRKAWHEALERINARLRAEVSSCRQKILQERAYLSGQLRSSAILSSREYSFCLFDSKGLRKTLLELSCPKS